MICVLRDTPEYLARLGGMASSGVAAVGLASEGADGGQHCRAYAYMEPYWIQGAAVRASCSAQ